MKIRLAAINNEHSELTNEVEILKNRIGRQVEDLEDAHASLAETETKMTGLFEEAKTNPNDQTTRAATLISMTYNRKLSRVERIEKRITDSKARIKKLQQQQLNLSKIETSLQNKINQAIVDNEKKAAIHKQVAQKRLPSEQVKTQTPVAKLPPIKKIKTPTPAPIKKPTHKAQWPSLEKPHPADIKFAKASIASALKQLNQGEKPLLPKVIAEAKQSFGSIRMSYIGDDLYSVTTTAKAGNLKISVFKKDFWVTIPKDDTPYRIIYDTTSLSKPNLYVIENSLLEEPRAKDTEAE
jgi:hypothetical protein